VSSNREKGKGAGRLQTADVDFASTGARLQDAAQSDYPTQCLLLPISTRREFEKVLFFVQILDFLDKFETFGQKRGGGSFK